MRERGPRGLRALVCLLLACCLWPGASPTRATDSRHLTFVHTNDLQSRLLGFAPNLEYTPLSTGDDRTLGGIARLATIVRQLHAEDPEGTLVLDGGDFMMGTLFQTLGEQEGAELRLMQSIGYDAVAIGNHEFDFRSTGLANILRAARRAGPVPRLLLANLRFDPDQKGDDELESLVAQGWIEPWTVLERKGLRVGLFGLMGPDAVSVADYAAPAFFADPVETARAMTRLLLEEQKVDLVVCLSHGGVFREDDGTWGGDDVELARAVPEIDVVIGGHSHTPLFEPIRIGETSIVQAGSDGRYVGTFRLEVDAEGIVTTSEYRLVAVDDQTLGAEDIHREVERLKRRIDEEVLAPFGLTFDQPLAATAFDLPFGRGLVADSPLGPLVADSIRWGVGRGGRAEGEAPVQIGLTTAGFLRDSILRGETGVQGASDLFRIVPIGIGTVDDRSGYPLVRVYVTPKELRGVLEVLSVAWRLKGSRYYPYLSGVRFRYNPNRLPFDRVFSIELENADGTFRPLDPRAEEPLIGVAFNAFVYGNMEIASEISGGLVAIEPKNARGEPLESLEDALVDLDPERPGIQENKVWASFLAYVQQLPDLDGDGIPDLPERYRTPEPRMVAEASWSPGRLVAGSWGPMWVVVLGTPSLATVLLLWIRRRRAD